MIRVNVSLDTLYDHGGLILKWIVCIWTLGIALAVLFMLLAHRQNWDVRAIAGINLALKLLHIPALIVDLLLAVWFFCGLITAGISLVLALGGVLTIFRSGLCGVTAAMRGWSCGKCSDGAARLLGLLQFVIFLAVICAAILYWMVRRSSGIPRQTTEYTT